MKPEVKTFEFKVTDAEDDNGKVGYIKGYASTFGNMDLGGDIVEKGAFKKTIKDKNGKFPILLDHDPRRPIGWNIDATEDDHGLKVEGEIYLETEEARMRYLLAKKAREHGTKMGLSIGYSTIKWTDEKDEERDRIVRRLKEVKLYEYSFVLNPMNEEAGITHAKSADYELLLKELTDFQGALRRKAEAASSSFDPQEFLQSADILLKAMKRGAA